ncbi:MAG: PEP/pyruvate-binding domain-containing protein [Candidatus Dojkabacteria bacterium]|jgi:pyruvate,water dikinase
MESSNAKKNSVFFFEDFAAKDLNRNRIGRKGYSLFKLKDMDVPVPDFFVVSSNVFTSFCMNALDSAEEKLLSKGRNPEAREIEEAFLKADFDKGVEEEILSAYTRLSGFTEAWVSVRSSVVFPNGKDISFSGIFTTELNVRKFDQLLDSIKRVYASVFTDDVVAYASRVGIDLADVKMAVVVQRMVQSEISGVIFTVDPITQDNSKLSIEAVYGLGDVISLGELTPDSYLLNKKDLAILEKHIAPQEWMKVRTMRPSGRNSRNAEKIKISMNWSHRQKLSDKDMEEISKIALVIEDKSREVQNIEWVLAGGRFWILQNKPLYEVVTQDKVFVGDTDISRKNIRELVIAFLEKYRVEKQMVSSAMNEAQKIVERNSDEVSRKLEELIYLAKKGLDTDITKKEITKDDLVLTGIGASFGVAVGNVKIAQPSDKKKLSRKDILVIKNYSSEMESMILDSGGVILDTGGVTSDTAILCREFNIPAVVGAGNASEVLKNGDFIRIDGSSGTVYREKEVLPAGQDTHPVVDAYVAGDVKVSTENVESEKKKEEKPTVPVKDSTLPPSATKIYSTANISSEKLFEYIGDADGIVYVDLDRIMIENGKHPLEYVKEKKFVEYTKEICEKVLEYVNLLSGNDLVLSIGSSKVKEFMNLKGGKEHEEGSSSPEIRGAMHYINNPDLLKRVATIVKRLRNVYRKRNVSLAVHSPMSDDVMKEFKKLLSGEKLRRTSSFGIFAILDNPAEVILAEEISNSKIDGLILNMPAIAKQMQGFKIDTKDAKYDLARHSVFKVLDNVLEVVKPKAEKVIVMVENSKPLLKYCVQAGVYGVSVFPEDIKEARKVAFEEESKIILGK